MDAKAERILEAAVSLAADQGFPAVTRNQVAARVGCAPSLVSHYWGEIRHLQERVMALAVERGMLRVVAQGLLDKHPTALAAPPALLEHAAQYLIHG